MENTTDAGQYWPVETWQQKRIRLVRELCTSAHPGLVPLAALETLLNRQPILLGEIIFHRRATQEWLRLCCDTWRLCGGWVSCRSFGASPLGGNLRGVVLEDGPPPACGRVWNTMLGVAVEDLRDGEKGVGDE
jgi:hypothetical protein